MDGSFIRTNRRCVSATLRLKLFTPKNVKFSQEPMEEHGNECLESVSALRGRKTQYVWRKLESRKVRSGLKGYCYCSTHYSCVMKSSSMWHQARTSGYSALKAAFFSAVKGPKQKMCPPWPSCYHGTSQTTYFRPLCVTRGQCWV